MNYRIVIRTLGFILLFEAVFFIVPAITAVCYWEEEFFSFLISIFICAACGSFCLLVKNKDDSMYAKEGFVIVALSWIVMSVFGAFPFWFSGAIPSYIDALFETVSGFSTTGATILPSGAAIEALPKSLLMWRSFTHWIGGMGVLVFVMVFLPLSGGRNISLLKAESTGAAVSKLVPKMRKTARILYLIYTALTLLEFVFLVFDMPLFDAITTAFATAGTGGFAIKGDSFASYSTYSQIVVTVFMILFSINFTSFYLILCGRIREAFNTEVRTFFCIVFAAIALISLDLCLSNLGYSVGEAILHSAFSVASIISTTGFTTANFNLWSPFAQTILVLLMFIGACAGSTGGGMKVSRMMVLFKGSTHEVKRILHPRQVKKITIEKRIVEHEVVRGINAYLFAYILIFVVSLLIISLNGFDFVTNFTSVAATLNNIGPGLGMVGPDGNFAAFSELSKLTFIFNMLAGRLEVFPMLVLFAPSTWRK